MAQLGVSTDRTAAETTGTTSAQKLKMAQQDMTRDPTAAQVARVAVETLGPTDQVERGAAELEGTARMADAMNP